MKTRLVKTCDFFVIGSTIGNCANYEVRIMISQNFQRSYRVEIIGVNKRVTQLAIRRWRCVAISKNYYEYDILQ